MATPVETKMCRKCGLVTKNLKSRYCARCGHDQFGNVQDEHDSAAWENNQIPNTTNTANDSSKNNNKGIHPVLMLLFAVLVVMVTVIICCFLSGMLTITVSDQNIFAAAPTASAAPAASAPAANANGYVSNYEQYAINENGAAIADQTIYNQPYEAGVMITNDSKQSVWYVQSGKTGTVILHGYVKKGEILAIDANVLKLPYEPTYKNGSIKFLAGPLDLEKYQITMTNGAAQLVKPEFAQAFLDFNMAPKFARGDWDKKLGQFSYKAWDLQEKQIWVLGYTYNSLVGKINADNDDYPR